MKKIIGITLLGFSFILMSSSFSKKPSAKRAIKVLNGFCSFIPSGNSVIDSDTVSVQSFYMSNTEITNIQYMEFIHYLKKHGEDEKLAIANVDTLQWVQRYDYMSAYTEYYHKHPAYHEYPVVNVSKEGAELYCEWLSMMYDSISGGELNLKFRIPTRSEWMRAARGENHQYFYTWGTPSLRNSEGLILANHVRFGAEHITRNINTGKLEITNNKVPYDMSSIGDNADVLAPSKSYWPNDFGIYNMNGNASEMISDGEFVVGGDWRSPGYDIRNESIKAYKGPSPEIGFRIVASYIQEVK